MSTSFEKGDKTVFLPAGKYIIGDPCYIVPDEEWDKVLEESDFFNGQCWASFKQENGKQTYVVAFSTAWGDGVYIDQFNHDYPVDAGLIGIVPYLPDTLVPSGTNLVDFQNAVYCYAKEGKINFGRVAIDTDPNNDDYYDPEEDFCS